MSQNSAILQIVLHRWEKNKESKKEERKQASKQNRKYKKTPISKTLPISLFLFFFKKKQGLN